MHFFALSVITSLKIPGAVIPRRVFTRPGSIATGWNQQQVQPCPLFGDRYRSGEPLNPTFRATNRPMRRCKQRPKRRRPLIDIRRISPGQRTAHHVTEIVDANDVVERVVHRLIAREIGFAEDRRLAINASFMLMNSITLPLGSRMVPMAREPSSFFTLVATRTKSARSWRRSWRCHRFPSQSRQPK